METPRIRLHVRIRPEIPRTTPHDHRRATVPIRIRHHHPKRNRSQRRRITSMHPGRRTIRHRLRTHAHQTRNRSHRRTRQRHRHLRPQNGARGRGRTIAFIGTGIDRQYPAENRDLQKRIENEGLVLSQFMPGAEPTRQTFPMRNALMSGYGIATIIADANEHSGTRIQARQAQRHGRPVILNHTVMDGTQWGRELADKPGVYVVRDASGASDALDYIMSIDDVDMLARQLLDAAPAAI